MTSIRRRLLLSLLAGLLITTVIMAVVVYIDTTQELQKHFSENLERMAVVIKGEALASSRPAAGSPDIDTGELEETYVIQIWNADGTLHISSRPDTALPLTSSDGLHDIFFGSQQWEIYRLKSDPLGFVQIAQPRKIVTTMIGESSLRALLPIILLFVLLALGVWYAVGRSLVPLEALSRRIRDWHADGMQPLAAENTPLEIQPIVSALNTLLSRLDKAMSLQRQFTADAAHELRTPLTAIKIQLHNLLRAPSEPEREEATDRLSEGIERCIHLAAQLLLSSRNVMGERPSQFEEVCLNEVVRSSMTTFVPLAIEKKIEVAFDCRADCFIRGDEEGLRVLVNNLLDNAVRYTPEGGAVQVTLSQADGQTILEVSDNGKGIAESERSKIFQRFYRIPGSRSTGSGLGLSIVKSVAENHRATVEVMGGPNRQGTSFRILFPASLS